MATAPRIHDPRAVPVVGHDAHLPALDIAGLSALGLRERLEANAAQAPEWPGDALRFHPERPWTPASVLVPLVQRAHGWQVLLTERTAHLRDHAGQISFPGGRREPEDRDAVATALREAEEEVGIDAAHVEVLGLLPAYHTVTSYEVTPVVAWVRPGFRLAPDPHEVAEVFEVPLQFLMTPAHHRRHRVRLSEQEHRDFLSMPWRSPEAREYFIWGATAAMLRNLYRSLAAAQAPSR